MKTIQIIIDNVDTNIIYDNDVVIIQSKQFNNAYILIGVYDMCRNKEFIELHTKNDMLKGNWKNRIEQFNINIDFIFNTEIINNEFINKIKTKLMPVIKAIHEYESNNGDTLC